MNTNTTYSVCSHNYDAYEADRHAIEAEYIGDEEEFYTFTCENCKKSFKLHRSYYHASRDDLLCPTCVEEYRDENGDNNEHEEEEIDG